MSEYDYLNARIRGMHSNLLSREFYDQILASQGTAPLIDALLKWEDDNPLVRNVFVWHPEAGLQFPLEGVAATSEEQRFTARYPDSFLVKAVDFE